MDKTFGKRDKTFAKKEKEVKKVFGFSLMLWSKGEKTSENV